jgi:D-glycero-alpha-D-manno-heptose-7-phosphate kinase
LFAHVSVYNLLPYHHHKTRLVYSDIELVKDHSEISHRAIKACFDLVGVDDGLEVVYHSDIPARSGTGSSSSFLVGLLHALSAHRGQYLSPDELAQRAIHIEQDVLRENVGYQDSIWAALPGGLGTIRFYPGGDYVYSPLALTPDHEKDLEQHLLLAYTTIQRTSSEVAASYYGKLKDTLGRHFAMIRLAEDGCTAIRRADYERLGHLIDQSWRLKSGLSPEVCSPAIAELYMRARLAGSWGGKLMGAGAGGCLALVVPPEKRADVVAALREGGALPIAFHFCRSGSHIAFADRS